MRGRKQPGTGYPNPEIIGHMEKAPRWARERVRGWRRLLTPFRGVPLDDPPPLFTPDLDLIGDMQKSENGPRETR